MVKMMLLVRLVAGRDGAHQGGLATRSPRYVQPVSHSSITSPSAVLVVFTDRTHFTRSSPSTSPSPSPSPSPLAKTLAHSTSPHEARAPLGSRDPTRRRVGVTSQRVASLLLLVRAFVR